MIFNYQKARNLMVENQLRPNKIKEEGILSVFRKISKEAFLPKDLESLAYSDMDITLGSNRGYLKNLHIAQLIKHAEIEKTNKVLHIGALTGYVSILISDLCFEIFAIEEEDKHLAILKENIKLNSINNISVLESSFKWGNLPNAPYDRIIIDSPIKEIGDTLLTQLSEDGGQLIMIKLQKIKITLVDIFYLMYFQIMSYIRKKKVLNFEKFIYFICLYFLC